MALPDDAQDPVAALHAHVLDVGAAGLGDPQPVQPEEHGQGGVGVIEPLGGEQQPGQLAAIEAPPLRRLHRGAAHVLGRIRCDPPVDVGEAVEPAGGGQPPVDSRRRQAPLLHRAPVQLQVGPASLQDRKIVVGGPLKQGPQVMTVGLQGPAAIAARKATAASWSSPRVKGASFRGITWLLDSMVVMVSPFNRETSYQNSPRAGVWGQGRAPKPGANRGW